MSQPAVNLGCRVQWGLRDTAKGRLFGRDRDAGIAHARRLLLRLEVGAVRVRLVGRRDRLSVEQEGSYESSGVGEPSLNEATDAPSLKHVNRIDDFASFCIQLSHPLDALVTYIAGTGSCRCLRI